MKIIKALVLDKYSDDKRYSQYDEYIFKDLTGGIGGKMGISSEPSYCITLYAELEEGEDTQYPLEDILDEYLVNCTDVIEEKEEDGKRIYIFEIESEDEETIKTIAGLIGKRVYNYEDGDYINLGIE